MADFHSPQNRPLDQPQTCDFDDLDAHYTWLLANHEVRVQADRQSDLADLQWPWASARYARTITTRLATVVGDDLVPIVNRYYPGYQETIYGSEGLIVSKRLVVPLHSADDRALFWSYECQAEGDSVLRLDVEIDWGEPLTQRMVDGLLVAQCNPRAEQGIYRQSNADSTRVFGNPNGRPDVVTLDDVAGTAHLTYYVLVNGIVDVSLLLTLSDVGEQMAWNSFLALRDTEQVFARSNRVWEDLLQSARLWTPDARTNQLVQMGKRDAILHLVHLPAGMAPASLATKDAYPLIGVLDALEPAQSRNLLAHMRRLAELGSGHMPTHVPQQAKDQAAPAHSALQAANSVYLSALAMHATRHPDALFFTQHETAISLCMQVLAEHNLEPTPPLPADAARLHMQPDAPWHFADPWAGMAYAMDQIWTQCGVAVDGDDVIVQPAQQSVASASSFPEPHSAPHWPWWALLNLPIRYTSTPPSEQRLSLVWDGATLHTTQPVRTTLPVIVHHSMRALHTDELDFDLTFEFVDTRDNQRTRTRFHPTQWL